MSAYDGSLSADQATGTVQVRVDGRPPLTFENATISVSRSRIDVVARTPEHTLVAWILRRSGAGGVGLLQRTDNPRKPLRFGFRPTSFGVENEPPVTIIRR